MAQQLANLEGCCVLIAEDEPVIALILKDVIEGAGGTIAGVASSCSEALRMIDERSVQLVVLDVHLEGHISDAVLQAADAKRIPVLISSGSDSRALLEGYRGRPMLAKPWTTVEAEHALLSSLMRK